MTTTRTLKDEILQQLGRLRAQYCGRDNRIGLLMDPVGKTVTIDFVGFAKERELVVLFEQSGFDSPGCPDDETIAQNIILELKQTHGITDESTPRTV